MNHWGQDVYEHRKDNVINEQYNQNLEFFTWFYEQKEKIITHWVMNGGDTQDKDGIIEFAKQIYEDFI